MTHKTSVPAYKEFLFMGRIWFIFLVISKSNFSFIKKPPPFNYLHLNKSKGREQRLFYQFPFIQLNTLSPAEENSSIIGRSIRTTELIPRDLSQITLLVCSHHPAVTEWNSVINQHHRNSGQSLSTHQGMIYLYHI